MFKRWREKTTIPSILDQDIPRLIQELGLQEKVASGTILCSFCDSPITLENIGCIFLENEQINFSCDQFICCFNVIKKQKVDNT